MLDEDVDILATHLKTPSTRARRIPFLRGGSGTLLPQGAFVGGALTLFHAKEGRCSLRDHPEKLRDHPRIEG